jgi:hypothetical protein
MSDETYKKEEKPDTESAQKIARETMTGDLRDVLLNFLKHEKNPLPWNMQTEDQQSALIEKVTHSCQVAVERAVKTIAADGRKAIVCMLDKVTVKDGIQAVLKLSKEDEQRHSLIDSQGSTVLLVVADIEAYTGERKAALPEPNQNSLPMDDEDDDIEG